MDIKLKMRLFYILVVYNVIAEGSGLPKVIRIGAIFTGEIFNAYKKSNKF